jgi:N-methylhydantoinase A
VEIINLRLTAVGKIPKTLLAQEEPARYSPDKAVKGERNVYFPEFQGRVPTKIYDSSLLKPGHSISGPAIIEAVTTTIVICPGDKASVDDFGNIILEVS